MVWWKATAVLLLSWMGCFALRAQDSFVSEISVPGYGKAELDVIVPAPRDGYFNAFFTVASADNPNQKRVLRASFTPQGDLIDAEWLTEMIDTYGSLVKVEELDPMRLIGKYMIAVSGNPGRVGVYDRFNSADSWLVAASLHTAVIGRPSIGDPNRRVIAALAWGGDWMIYVLDPEDGRLIRAFRFTNRASPTFGQIDESYLTWCCMYSRHILAYDEASGNFLLVTGAYSSLRNHWLYLVYAFTAEGDLRWVLAFSAGFGDGYHTGGDKIGILPLNDGTAAVYYTYYDQVFLCRIDTRLGRLLSAVAWSGTPWQGGSGTRKLQYAHTRTYGGLLGYVGDYYGNGIFGGVRESDWNGWQVSIPDAQLHDLKVAGVSLSGDTLWAVGGNKTRGNAAVLAVFEPDTWAEFPFSFYPCFESRQAPQVLPLGAVIAENGSASVESVSVSPTSSAFAIRSAALQVTRSCEVSECVPSNGDVNGDGCVDDADLLAVLFAFGQTGTGLPEDVNCDGVVDDADLLTVLFNFGSGC